MGRPIKKSFFGNLNSPYNDFATGGVTGAGGEGVDTITIDEAGTLYESTATVALSAPEVPGGVQATASITVSTSTGEILTVSLVNAGSGYLAAPTATVSPATRGTEATFVVALTATNGNALNVTAYLPLGSSAVTSDIKKQESSRRYLVRNAQGSGQCKLVAKASNALAAGEMNLIAEDSVGGTYYVTKLTARRAVITRATGTQFATGSSVGWSLTTAVASVSVKLSNG